MHDLGRAVAFLGVTYGALLTVAAAGRLARGRARPAGAGPALAGAALVLASLAAPWARGTARGTARPLELSGGEVLDPVTTGALVALALAGAGAAWLPPNGGLVSPRGLRAGIAASAGAVVAGKLLVYGSFDHFDPAPAGFALAAAGAVLLLVAAARAPSGNDPPPPEG